MQLFFLDYKANGGNRTRNICLEGRGFTTKLHSQIDINYMQLLTIAAIAQLSKFFLQHKSNFILVNAYNVDKYKIALARIRNSPDPFQCDLTLLSLVDRLVSVMNS